MEGRPRTADEGTETRSFSCWPSLWQEARRVAAREGKSVSEIIREALAGHLARQRDKNGGPLL